jgi:aspartate/methionine/tyrosine aminotransferase
MPFSKRVSVAHQPGEFAALLEQEKSKRGVICDLTISNPTQAGLPYDNQEIVAALTDPDMMTYTPQPLGQRAARNTLASLWAGRNVSVAADQIALTSGTSEAYGYLFKLLCDPGDDVLVPEPSYPLLSELARYESVVLSPYRLAYDGAFHVDIDSVRAAIGPRTRAIVCVSPNNPTGTYVKEEEFRQLFQLGLPLISDEVFSAYALNGARHPSALEVAQSSPCPELVFVLDGLSKFAGLPQVKLAWLTAVGPKAKVRAAMHHLEFLLDAYLSVATHTQLALPRLLQVSHTTRNAILARIHRNLACVQARVAGSAVTLLSVEGGWSVPLRLPELSSDSDWALGLVRDCQVLTQPGWFYDFQMDSVLVLSLLTPEQKFEQGLSQLLAYVDDRIRRESPRPAGASAVLHGVPERQDALRHGAE